MSFTLKLNPSGRECIAARHETVLDALLRAGINVPYNCKNGSCGQCTARLLEGRLDESLPHDFHLTAGDKQRGGFLMCAAKPASDLVIESRIIGDANSIPMQEIAARVYKIDAPAENIRIIQLRTPRSQTLQFLAGQYVTLHIDGLEPRSKSIASCPCNGMYLQFHVRYSEDDPFADYVFHKLGNKQQVLLRGPEGQFTLDEASSRALLFIANDTGIAPIKSLIEHSIALESAQSMHLYWIMQNRQENYLANFCRSLQDALDNFRYTPLYMDELIPAGTDKTRQLELAAQRIAVDYPNLSGFDVYVNGPVSLYTPLIRVLQQHQLPAQQLFVDAMQHY